jgi:hypothetical protein
MVNTGWLNVVCDVLKKDLEIVKRGRECVMFYNTFAMAVQRHPWLRLANKNVTTRWSWNHVLV